MEDVFVVEERVSEKAGLFLYHAELELTGSLLYRSTGAP